MQGMEIITISPGENIITEGEVGIININITININTNTNTNIR